MRKKENNMICFEKVLEILLNSLDFLVLLDLKIYLHDFDEQILDHLDDFHLILKIYSDNKKLINQDKNHIKKLKNLKVLILKKLMKFQYLILF
jgi:energy-converting hydrogenase A subunit M